MTKITDEAVDAAATELLAHGEFSSNLDRNIPNAIIAARAALEAALPHLPGVSVKPLEWTRGWMNAEAQTEIGQYIITYRRDGSFEWGIGILKGWASSWDEAKSAAQADYERRILSALSSPAPEAATHRHKKSGTEYVLIGIGKMQAKYWYLPGAMEAGPSVDMQEVAIYRSVDDGSLWVRPREEFEDGRFEIVASHEAPVGEAQDGLTLSDEPQPTPDAAEELEVVAHLRLGATQLYKGLYPGTSEPLVRQSDALAIIEEQARTIEKLRAEIETTNLSWNQTSGMLGFALKRANLAEARLAEAVEALRPFAKIGGFMRHTPGGRSVSILYNAVEPDGLNSRGSATTIVDAFLGARTFLQSLGKESGNG